MGSAELGFQLGFDSNLIDDIRLGFRTGKRPAYIVMEKRYAEWLDWAKTNDPPNYAYIETLLAKEYRLLYDHLGYRIYERLASAYQATMLPWYRGTNVWTNAYRL